MGYQTTYYLELEPFDASIAREFLEQHDYPATIRESNLNYADPCKWYNWEKDMQEFSKKHPETFFRLEGLGEEQGDWWIAGFLNGIYFLMSCEPPQPVTRDDLL